MYFCTNGVGTLGSTRSSTATRELAADVALRRNARAAVVKDDEPVERHRIPPDGREVKSHGEVVIGTLLHTAGGPFVYQASCPLPAGKAGDAAGADAPPEDLKGYRPDFYLPDDPDPAAPVTASGGIWLEHYAHDRSGRAPGGVRRLRGEVRLEAASAREPFDALCRDLLRGPAALLGRRRTGHGRGARRTAAGDGPDAGPGPLTLEVDAWIGAVRRRRVRTGRLPLRMALPYDTGNAGDLLKHGVLAEVVRWQCEQGIQLRFIDLFGGEPWKELVPPEVTRRVRGLATACALRAAQTGIKNGRYYGSSWVVRHTVTEGGTVLTTDQDQERRKRLCDSGLSLLTEDFPNADLSDSYAVFENDVVPNTKDGDLALIDPFADLLLYRAPTVVPQMAKMARRAAVLLFALNLNSENWVGQRFDRLLTKHLPGAWHLTCPPLHGTGVDGESKYRAEVVLAARWLNSSDALWKRLAEFAEQLAGVLDLAAKCVPLRVVPSDRRVL